MVENGQRVKNGREIELCGAGKAADMIEAAQIRVGCVQNFVRGAARWQVGRFGDVPSRFSICADVRQRFGQ